MRKSCRRLLFLVLMFASVACDAETVLITGANRGIGLEFVRQYAARGWQVIATHRRETTPESLGTLQLRYPQLLKIERMDVTDHEMIDALAERFTGKPIDVLINNAGIVGALDYVEEQKFGQLDYELLALFYRINVVGPLKVTEAFLDNLRLGEGKRMVAISSMAGSFQASSRNRPGRIHYKTSKAALNMAVTGIADATRADGIIAVSLNPGGVKVEKLAGYDLPGFIEPAESIAGMIAVIEALDPEDSGAFLDYRGEVMPW